MNGCADVLFVTMPFGPLFKPSIGLSLLKAALDEADIRCELRYFTLDFAAQVGDDYYTRIAEGEPTTRLFIGEWCFAPAVFGSSEHHQAYWDRLLDPGATEDSDFPPIEADYGARIRLAHELADAFVDDCVAEVLARKPRIVGLTSTFQQHLASLALAQRLKRVAPDITIIMGGANCEAVMGAETLRQFEFIDIVVSGEGDQVIVPLITGLLDGAAPIDLPGVYTRDRVDEMFASGRFPTAPPVRDMDGLPRPDYDDYFGQFKRRAAAFKRTIPDVLFETSRGCWWGEKSHCTFCGLNGSGMRYRSKSQPRALQEFRELTERYPDSTVNVVDNILDPDYFRHFIPALAELPGPVDIFYETKSNLKKNQVAQMARAGISTFQPGIESLSSDVLRLMGKGVSALQNVQLLKWSAEHGIRPYWNVLWGFPREQATSYEQMASWLPLLHHLQPPLSSGPIHLDRFSPNFDFGEALGFTNIRPFPAYDHIYPFAPEVIANLAYYFDYDYIEPQPVARYVEPVLDEIRRWKRCHPAAAFFFTESNDQVQLWDFRHGSDPDPVPLDDESSRIYRGLDAIASSASLSRWLANEGQAVDEPRVAALLRDLVDRGAVLQEGDRYLALAIPLAATAHGFKPAQSALAAFYQRALASLLQTPAEVEA